ncbi:hypothetical protein PMI35_00979 [Pseudomonas sp. GM78]|nr:hypothetical protein PMI35_00979 [Pseudomonas sp. GM78]
MASFLPFAPPKYRYAEISTEFSRCQILTHSFLLFMFNEKQIALDAVIMKLTARVNQRRGRARLAPFG